MQNRPAPQQQQPASQQQAPVQRQAPQVGMNNNFHPAPQRPVVQAHPGYQQPVLSPLANTAKSAALSIAHPSRLYGPVAKDFSTSPIATGARVVAAQATSNPTALQNARVAFNKSWDQAAKQTTSSIIAGNFTGAGGGKLGKSPAPLGSAPKAPPVSIKPVIRPAGKGTLTKLTIEDKANLSPSDQMTLHKLEGMGPPSKAQIAAGMKVNPFKSNVHEVAPGNWVGARTAGDAVSDPISKAGKITNYHLGKLAGDNPSLHAKFWDAVETGKTPEGAPNSFKDAAKWFRETANGIHKESNVLGTPTRYHKNWELRAASLKDVTPETLGSGELGPAAKHAIERKYGSHAEFVAAAEKAGMAVEKDPSKALQKYVTAASSSLQRKALVQSLAEADKNNPVKPHTVDLGWGNTVKLSDEGLHQAKGVLPMTAKKTKAGTFYDASNSLRKGLLLSVSQFHTVNVVGLRAAPALAMPKPGYLLKGDLTAGSHPIRAGKAVGGAVRNLFPGGEKNAVHSLEKAYERGDVQFAARHGSRIGETAYGASKHFNLGQKRVFDIQLPEAQIQVIGALRRDLKKFGIKEGSPEALEAGKVANFTMGFINRAAMNMSPALVKTIERTMLAGQFTPSKLANLYKGSTKLGLAGSMARADVAANAITAAATIVGVGWLVRQKSDDIRDMVLRALIDPAIPTNIQDKPKYPGAETNTQEVRIPMTYTSEIAHILGVKLVRQADGHLGVSFSPKNMPQTTADWARARLSPNLADVVKIKTNTEFGDKPLYEEGAGLKKQVTQVATKTIQGGLPIGAQGLGYTDFVKNHVPEASKEVLDAGTPSTNPFVKSLASSTGFTVRTDKTVGKSLSTNHYFNGVDQALTQAKNNSEKAALQNYLGSKKNSVTGKYNVEPNVNDGRRKAADLLDAPNSINILMSMNQKLKAQGEKVDPLWGKSKDEITSYFQYQAMPPGGADRKKWVNDHPWYYGNPDTPGDKGLSGQRQTFFDSLPKGDPNKPNAPIEYPQAPKETEQKMEKYFSINDPAEASKYLRQNPELEDRFNKLATYNNELRKAQGYAELDTYPKPPKPLQDLMDTYNNLPQHDGKRGGSKTRAIWIQNHPAEWGAMTKAWTQQALYNLEQDAGQAAFKDTGFSQKGLKSIFNLGQYDIQKTTDENGNTFYKLGSGDGSSSGGGSGYSRRGYSHRGGGGGGSGGSNGSSPPTGVIKLTKGKVSTPKVKGNSVVAAHSTLSNKSTNPKVSLKKSKV